MFLVYTIEICLRLFFSNKLVFNKNWGRSIHGSNKSNIRSKDIKSQIAGRNIKEDMVDFEKTMKLSEIVLKEDVPEDVKDLVLASLLQHAVVRHPAIAVQKVEDMEGLHLLLARFTTFWGDDSIPGDFDFVNPSYFTLLQPHLNLISGDGGHGSLVFLQPIYISKGKQVAESSDLFIDVNENKFVIDTTVAQLKESSLGYAMSTWEMNFMEWYASKGKGFNTDGGPDTDGDVPESKF